MATIVNNPPATAESNPSGGMGFLIGALLLIVFLFLLFFYGLPAIRNVSSQPTINVPGKIDVNVNTSQGNNPGQEQ